jgi:hypothetical protein
MTDLELKFLERKCLESLKRAYGTLRDDAVLPATMTFRLGEYRTDIGAYAFELKVSLISGVSQKP